MQFIKDYRPYIDDDLMDKLERKRQQTKELTPESFDALMKEYVYLDIDGRSDVIPIPEEGIEAA